MFLPSCPNTRYKSNKKRKLLCKKRYVLITEGSIKQDIWEIDNQQHYYYELRKRRYKSSYRINSTKSILDYQSYQTLLVLFVSKKKTNSSGL